MADFSVIQQLIATVCPCELEEITPEKHLVGDLQLDSFGLMELVIIFEKEFHIDIPDRDLRYFDTVSDVASYIDEKASGSALVRA